MSQQLEQARQAAERLRELDKALRALGDILTPEQDLTLVDREALACLVDLVAGEIAATRRRLEAAIYDEAKT